MEKQLECENQFYLDNHAKLYDRFGCKVVAIKGENVLGVFDNFEEAEQAVFSVHDPATVLLQQMFEVEPYYRTGEFIMVG